MKLITLSGVDGSGKSTQIELLKNALEKGGRKVYYFHAIQFSIANKKHITNKPGNAKAVTNASWYKIQLRKFALLIDLLRFERLLTTLGKSDYTHLVSDRYFYDTLINILYLSHGRWHYSFGVTLLETLVRKPDHAFYLKLSTDTILMRARTIEQGEKYLREKIGLFDHYTPQWNVQTISGEGSIEKVQQRIQHAIRTASSPS